MDNKNKDVWPQVDKFAKSYIELKASVEKEQAKLDLFRETLISFVRVHGSVPPRAIKTRAVEGVEYEIRMSQPVEVSVHTKAAKRLQLACFKAAAWRVFPRLFRKVETFVLADGSDRVMNGKLPEHAPRNLRSLFARAIRTRELAPQLEIRKREEGTK